MYRRGALIMSNESKTWLWFGLFIAIAILIVVDVYGALGSGDRVPGVSKTIDLVTHYLRVLLHSFRDLLHGLF